jgi:hypothetical protein
MLVRGERAERLRRDACSLRKAAASGAAVVTVERFSAWCSRRPERRSCGAADDTGTVSGSYLSLDQGMTMAAIGNELSGDVLRKASAGGEVERVLRPAIGIEQFGASARPG